MNTHTDTFIISRYAGAILFPIGALTLMLLLFVGLNIISFSLLLFFIFTLYTHRNPERISNFAQNGSVICPIDGKVKAINSIEVSPIDSKPGFELVIESNFTDVAVLRAPIDSYMKIEKLQRGAMLPLNSKLIALNETAQIRFSSKIGDILIKHTLGSWTRPLNFGIEGKILQNQRYGFMLKGSTSIYLPSNSRIAVKEGNSLRAGESVISFFTQAD